MRIIFIHLLITVFLAACGDPERDKPPGESSGGNQGVKGDSLSFTTMPSPSKKPEPPKPIDQLNRQERNEYKEELAKSGFYDCCIKPTCNMCLYDEAGQCPCADLIKKGDAVCGECHRGWRKGRGAVKGIDPKTVRRM